MNFNCVPATTFGKSKKGELSKEDKLYTPGPGAYKPIKSTIHEPTWIIGSEKRSNNTIVASPGPGSYNLRYNKIHGPAYSMAKKTSSINENKDIAKSPSPASYNPKIISKSSSCYTMGSKYKQKKSELSPGPGNYNIRTDKDLNKPSYVFGSEKRIDNSSLKDSPGPGKYNFNNINSILHQHPQYSFGKQKRISDDIVLSPGPGAYPYKEFIGKEGKAVPFGMRYKSQVFDNFPGPGQYNIEKSDYYKRKNYNTKIGTEKRFVMVGKTIENSPGPGQYNDDVKFVNVKEGKPSWKIGKANRDQSSGNIQGSPGPGNYNISKEIGDSAPHYSMGLKEKNTGDKDLSPGPARYDNDRMDLYRKSPAWKIGTGLRDDTLKRQISQNFPGPGRYESREDHLKSAPMYKFGKEKKLEDKSNGNPGPGSYHIPCSIIDVNSYTREQGKFDNNFKFI